MKNQEVLFLNLSAMIPLKHQINKAIVYLNGFITLIATTQTV